MKYSFLFLLAFFFFLQSSIAQIAQNISENGDKNIQKKPHRQVFFTWAWNKDYFTKSNLHFSDPGRGYDFRLYHVKAHDRPDYTYIPKGLSDFAIPQYSYRLGWFFKKKPRAGIEINFDHTKYVMTSVQKVHLKGFINDVYYDQDTLITKSFLKFEHTNGANFYLLNYFTTNKLFNKKNFSITLFRKAGAGMVIPKTDVTIFGTRLDNKYHVAGWMIGTEGDLRFEFFRHIYLEGGFKLAFADYVNVLVVGKGKANHCFGAAEWIFGLGLHFGI